MAGTQEGRRESRGKELFISIKSDLPSPPEARISSVKETSKNSVADTSVARNHKIEYTPSIMLLVQDQSLSF